MAPTKVLRPVGLPDTIDRSSYKPVEPREGEPRQANKA